MVRMAGSSETASQPEAGDGTFDPPAEAARRVVESYIAERRPDGDVEPTSGSGSLLPPLATGPVTWLAVDEPGEVPAASEVGSRVGVHVMLNSEPARRADRLDLWRHLWQSVVGGGFIAFTVTVDQPDSVDHDTRIEEILDATSGRVLTDDVVVHPRSEAVRPVWATVVLRRLGP